MRFKYIFVVSSVRGPSITKAAVAGKSLYIRRANKLWVFDVVGTIIFIGQYAIVLVAAFTRGGLSRHLQLRNIVMFHG